MEGRAGPQAAHAITLPDRPLFAFAGLWERWRPAGGEPVETFTIVTTEANPEIARIHDRMPVILPQEAQERWLGGETMDACALLKPYEGSMSLRAVGPLVGSPRNDVPECLDDAQPNWGQQQLL